MLGPVTVYANASLNYAHDKTLNYQIPDSPKSTAAIGIAYDHEGLYGSLFAKYIGQQYGDVNAFPISGFTIADLSLNYTVALGHERDLIKRVKVGLLIDNLFEKHGVSQLAGYTAGAGTPLFWNIVPRNFTATLSAAF